MGVLEKILTQKQRELDALAQGLEHHAGLVQAQGDDLAGVVDVK